MKALPLIYLLIITSCSSQEPTNGFDNPSFNTEFNESKAKKESRDTELKSMWYSAADAIDVNTTIKFTPINKKQELIFKEEGSKDYCYKIIDDNNLTETYYDCEGNFRLLSIQGNRQIDYPVEYIYSNKRDTFGFNRIEGSIIYFHDHDKYLLPKFKNLIAK